ncbi:MAG: phosphoribosylanthranilate isomerase [Planctomycetota bacterium]
MFVKICGITSAADWALAAEAGADAVGLNFVPTSKRFLSLAEARKLVRAQSGRQPLSAASVETSSAEATGVEAAQEAHGSEATGAAARESDSTGAADGTGRRRRQVELWGVFAGAELETVHQIIDEVGLDVVQLHGGESAEYARLVRQLGVRVVRVFSVEVEGAAGQAAGPLALPDVDATEKIVMVDAAVAGRSGGTGRHFDWRRLAGLHGCPGGCRVLLAGGLTSENVTEAIATARPWGVDVAGGVCAANDPRRKDPAKVREFIARARAAER